MVCAYYQNAHERILIHIEPLRKMIATRVASGEIDVNIGINHLEAIRWLKRVSKHIV